jgi:hypothetical protein
MGFALVTGAGLLALAACSSSSSSTTPTADGGTPDAKPASDAGHDVATTKPDAAADTGATPDASGDTGSAADTGTTADTGTVGDGGVADGAATDAQDAAVAFVPSALGAQLVLWLEADHGVAVSAGNGSVTTWADQSTYGNNAAVQAQDNPLIVNPTGIGGKPSIHFPGSATYLSIPDATSLDFSSSAITTWVVFQASSPLSVNSRILWTKQNLNSPYIGFGLYQNFGNSYGIASLLSGAGPYAVAASADAGQYDNDTPLLVIGSRDATNLSVTVAGNTVSVPPIIADAGVNCTTTDPLRIGGQTGGGGQNISGDIAAIFIATGAISSTDAAGMLTYIHGKYGL